MVELAGYPVCVCLIHLASVENIFELLQKSIEFPSIKQKEYNANRKEKNGTNEINGFAN